MLRALHAALILACLAVGITAIAAQTDAVTARQQLMKETSKNRSVLNRMIRGQAPYDQAAVEEAFTQLIVYTQKMPDVFVAGSYKGPDPKFEYYASPKAFESLDDIKARSAQLEKALIAGKAKVKDLESLKATWPAINKNQCEGCHEPYRLRRG